MILNRAKREILVVDALELKIVRRVRDCFHHTLSARVKPLCVGAYGQGFIIGGTDGYVAVYERTDAFEYRFLRNAY